MYSGGMERLPHFQLTWIGHVRKNNEYKLTLMRGQRMMLTHE